MTTYGRQLLTTTGYPVSVLADGNAERPAGGITIDWATVTAAGSDTTLADGTVIKNGTKGLVFGTVLCQITATGLWGPAATNAGGATAATDGRQLVARDATVILEQTILQNGPLGFGASIATDNPPVVTGGMVFAARLQVGGTGQPTLAQLETALPRLRLKTLVNGL